MTYVLVVDDEPQVRQALTYVLERGGFHCEGAGTVAAALALIDSHMPDVIVINATLGAESGLDLQRRIRSRSGWTPPVVFITGRRDLFPEMADLLGPADDWISKPWDRAELLSRVRLALQRAADQRLAPTVR